MPCQVLTPLHCAMQLQAHAAHSSNARIEQALANAAEAHDVAIRRIKADLQRKGALLAAAKTDSEKHLAAAQQSHQELERLKAATARDSAPCKGAQADLAAAHSALSKLSRCVHTLSALLLRGIACSRAGMHPLCMLLCAPQTEVFAKVARAVVWLLGNLQVSCMRGSTLWMARGSFRRTTADHVCRYPCTSHKLEHA
jgi:hypothetical protein